MDPVEARQKDRGVGSLLQRLQPLQACGVWFKLALFFLVTSSPMAEQLSELTPLRQAGDRLAVGSMVLNWAFVASPIG